MSKICNDKTGSDKKLHLFITFIIGAVLAALLSMFHFPSAFIAAGIDFAACIGIGVTKELHDRKQKGNHFCVWDLIWDAFGAIPAAVIAYFANYFTWV